MRNILFASLIIFFVSTSCTSNETLDNRKTVNNSMSEVNRLYELSKSDTLALNQRLLFLDKYINRIQEDSLMIKGLKQKTFLLGKKRAYDSCIIYSKTLEDIARRNNDSLNIGKALLKLGLYNRRINKIQESFNFYNQAYVNYKLINDSVNTAKSLLEMSKIQIDFGDYVGGKTTAIDGIRFLNKSSEDKIRVGLNQNITVALREERSLDYALEYNDKALLIAKEANYVKILQNTRANILADKGEYENAISILTKLKETSQLKTSNNNFARVIDNLGYINWKKDSLNEISEKLLIDAKKIRLQNNDVKGLISSNMHLAEFYFNVKPDKSIDYAKEALFNATKINSMVSQLKALSYIINLKDNPKREALSYTKIDKNLNNINQQNRELYSTTKYNNEKLLKDNSIIEADRLKKQKQNNWYLFGLITAILSSLLVVIILKNRHAKMQQEKVLETEKRISKRIHDELANDVYSSMVQLENNTASVSEVVDNLEGIYHKARDLSQEKTTIRSNKEFIDYLKKSLSSFNTEETNVIVQGLIPDIWIDVSNEKKLIVDRVIKELLVNMRKHSSANIVSVIFSRKNNIIKIGYTDNGVGTYKNEISKGVGLVNAENRIEAIGGSFIFDKSARKGFKIGIEIPV